MDPDDDICLCFRVSRRKLEKFVRVRQPRVPSQLSECGGAGTGCGWCVPILKVIHRQGTMPDDGTLTAAEYARRRGEYIRDGHGTPPAEG